MKKLNNKGNALVVILILLLVAAAVCFFIFKGKLGFGSGSDGDGSGDKNVESDISTEVTTEVSTTEQEGSADKTIVIVVKQSKYLIEDKEYTLAEIEGLIKDDTEKIAKYVMEDNYAGTEAWDQLKSLFSSYDITPIKED